MQADGGRIDSGGGPRDARLTPDAVRHRKSAGGWGDGPGAAWDVKQLIRPPARPRGLSISHPLPPVACGPADGSAWFEFFSGMHACESSAPLSCVPFRLEEIIGSE
jgi:hypothetical protein